MFFLALVDALKINVGCVYTAFIKQSHAINLKYQ